jgi:hypothetical protein
VLKVVASPSNYKAHKLNTVDPTSIIHSTFSSKVIQSLEIRYILHKITYLGKIGTMSFVVVGDVFVTTLNLIDESLEGSKLNGQSREDLLFRK